MYSIHYKDSVVRTMTGRGQDKLEKLVVTDMVPTVPHLNREVYTFHTSPDIVNQRPTSSPTSSRRVDLNEWTHEWTQ
jgi:hypothetical protein